MSVKVTQRRATLGTGQFLTPLAQRQRGLAAAKTAGRNLDRIGHGISPRAARAMTGQG